MSTDILQVSISVLVDTGVLQWDTGLRAEGDYEAFCRGGCEENQGYRCWRSFAGWDTDGCSDQQTPHGESTGLY